MEKLFDSIIILPFTKQTSKEAGKQLALLSDEGQQIEFRDILIGANAITERTLLKTNNKKHFSRIKGLELAG